MRNNKSIMWQILWKTWNFTSILVSAILYTLYFISLLLPLILPSTASLPVIKSIALLFNDIKSNALKILCLVPKVQFLSYTT